MPLIKLSRGVLTVILLLQQLCELIITKYLMFLLLILPCSDQLIRRCVPDIPNRHSFPRIHHPLSNSLSELPFLDLFFEEF
jgi:hypothetical protein